MSMIPTFKSDDYPDGRTKQSFKDQTNINKILAKAARGNTITHLAQYGAVYGDFSDIDDLLTAQERLQRGQEIFERLPGEIRREFGQDPRRFFKFVNDPQNAEDLPRVLPGLAKPGNQLGTVKRTAATVPADPVQPDPSPPVDIPPASDPS